GNMNTTGRRVVMVTVGLALLSAGSADAFDGKRKGFVIGGGLGPAPVVRWEGPVLEYNPVGMTWSRVRVDDSKFGVGAQLLVGYAWDEANMIVVEGNAAAMQSDILFDEPAVSQGFGGISWYHYFGEVGRTVFSAVGIGSYAFQIEDEEAAESEFGMLVGGGYEFSPHWQVGGYLTFGDTSDPLGDNDHVTFSVLIGAVAF
ncbi:MAG TPA: hypothetical protein VLB27_12325, partial [candidate division Zixibacteria bacterium]|nr:hypothetical protein [candidate division Zixibacteria bacterium]